LLCSGIVRGYRGCGELSLEPWDEGYELPPPTEYADLHKYIEAEERAAIQEYEAGMEREEAERRAYEGKD
jgi:hypothetical protein